MKTRALILAAGATCALSAAASAGTLFYNGELNANSPTFHHPNTSTAGSGVQFYSVQQISVDASGTYVFEAASPNVGGTPSTALDTFLAIYTGSFNPATPGAGNFSDDFTGTLTVLPGPFAPGVGGSGTGFTGAQPASRVSMSLTAGTDYFVVITSFRDTNFLATTGTTAQARGSYFIGIGGPGNIVPAPGAAALLGIGGLLAARRRRA